MSLQSNSEFVLLSPEEVPAEIYPFRRVWRAVLLEMGVMLGMVVLVLGGVLLGVLRDVPSRNWGALLILVPLFAYLWLSVRGEQRVASPRQGLLTVTLFSALLANGVALPLINNLFETGRWLADAGFFTRVLGYTFTLGVTAEFLKYIAVRYTVFPRGIRNRMDGIAYSVAASVGYATVLNFSVVLEREATVTADALRIAINFITQVSFGMVVGYFMAELALRDRPMIFLGMGLFAGALLHGLYIAFRAIASGSGFSVSNVNGLLVGLLFAVLVMLSINFLIRTFDAREAAQAQRRGSALAERR